MRFFVREFFEEFLQPSYDFGLAGRKTAFYILQNPLNYISKEVKNENHSFN
jgi:hypothetical protein